MHFSLHLCIVNLNVHWIDIAAEGSFERNGGDTKDHSLLQWFMKHSEAEDLNLLATARQQVVLYCEPSKSNAAM